MRGLDQRAGRVPHYHTLSDRCLSRMQSWLVSEDTQKLLPKLLCKETAHRAHPARLCCLQGLRLCSRTGTESSEGGPALQELSQRVPLLLADQGRSHAGPTAPTAGAGNSRQGPASDRAPRFSQAPGGQRRLTHELLLPEGTTGVPGTGSYRVIFSPLTGACFSRLRT